MPGHRDFANVLLTVRTVTQSPISQKLTDNITCSFDKSVQLLFNFKRLRWQCQSWEKEKECFVCRESKKQDMRFL